MKRWIYYVFGLWLLAGCEQSDIETYKADNYIQFVNPLSDSSTLSFLFYPGKTEIEVPVVVEMSGKPFDREVNYKVTVDAERSTAREGVHFSLPETFVMPVGKVTDTLWLKLYRLPEMKEKEFCIVLRVEENEIFRFGQSDHLENVWWVHDKLSRPEWWDTQIEWHYLGTYSNKKFQLFIEVTGIADLTDASDSEKRAATLKMYYYLESEKAKGNMIRDENGEEMTVEMIG